MRLEAKRRGDRRRGGLGLCDRSCFALLVAGGLVTAVLTGCHGASSRPAGAPVAIEAPLGLPPVPIPKDNPPTAATIALGRRLFYDDILSKGNSLSCSSCHQPEFGFRDARELSLGADGLKGKRHAPTLINSAYATRLFWDGRAKSLEDQVGFPIADPLEMNQTHEASVGKLKKNAEYQALFAAAFGSPGVTLERLEAAIATFERTIVSGDSPFDRYQYKGEKEALTAAQIRGLAVFTDAKKGNCAACHLIGASSALFTDGKFHNTGEGVGDDGQFTDQGYYEMTRENADRGAFKTPSLRDVDLSGPYMHDGRLRTLKDVVDFYAGHGNSNPYLDARMADIQLTGQDRSDLVEFMKALTGPLPKNLNRPQMNTVSAEATAR